MRLLALASGLMIGAFPAVSHGADDKYHITTAEKAACTQDALRFCYNTYPDEDKLFACMKQNHAALSSTCRIAFDAGIKRRHL